MNWIGLSLVTLVSFSLMNILLTYLTRKGTPVSFALFMIGVMFTIFYSIQTFVTTKFNFVININNMAILFLCSLFSVVGNWTLTTALRDAPNPGLAIAIASLNAGVVAILAIFFFKDKLTAMQIVGIILGVIAISLISLGSVGHK